MEFLSQVPVSSLFCHFPSIIRLAVIIIRTPSALYWLDRQGHEKRDSLYQWLKCDIGMSHAYIITWLYNIPQCCVDTVAVVCISENGSHTEYSFVLCMDNMACLWIVGFEQYYP